MNLKQLKAIIKETVREAVREELGLLLLEQKQQQILVSTPSTGALKENMSHFTTSDVDKVALRSSLKAKMEEQFGFPADMKQQAPVVASNVPATDNPFLSFILDSAQNMTPQDISGLSNLD